MSQKILLISHAISSRGDRASVGLEARGCRLEWCRPAGGEPLPGRPEDYDGVVVYGGAENISEIERHPYVAEEAAWCRRLVEGGGRYLGFCLGAQLLAHAFGARVAPHPEGMAEIGYFPVEPAPAGRESGFLERGMHAYQWHREGLELPGGATLLARGGDFPNQAFRIGPRAYGLQFHAETTPEIAAQWRLEAADVIYGPGAHDAERQVRETPLYDPTLAAWMEGFLDAWLTA